MRQVASGDGPAGVTVESIAFDDLILKDFASNARWHRANQRKPHEQDFVIFHRMPGAGEVFVDIGANIGLSIISFRLVNASAQIVSFEPLTCLEPALAALADLDSHLTYHMTGLGERDAVVPVWIPCVDRRPNFYLASLDQSLFQDDHRQRLFMMLKAKPHRRVAVCAVTATIAPLDTFNLSPTIMKIDVEGSEPRVLRGARSTIDNHRPMVLIEGANRDPDVRAFFDETDYRFCERVGDQLSLSNRPSASVNGFYVASERLPEYGDRRILRHGTAPRPHSSSAGLCQRTGSPVPEIRSC
jgi:FkbM family methyltransferase